MGVHVEVEWGIRRRPTNLMVSVLTYAMRSSVALPVRMDFVMNYSGVKPTCSTMNWMAVLSDVDI